MQIAPPTPGTDQGPPKPHGGDSETEDTLGSGNDKPPLKAQPRRFYGTVDPDATRVGRDAGKIAEEVIAHLAGLVGARVNVTVEICPIKRMIDQAHTIFAENSIQNGDLLLTVKWRRQG
ncbi:MAG: hypothetical protein V2I40_02300 [Desulfobacteraceae bacterium]|jgi:hypothetical protein|nr:hypothetical protein [Desulfobacteraceae bacterium]